jgi:hypothetical protein
MSQTAEEGLDGNLYTFLSLYTDAHYENENRLLNRKET